MTKNLENKTPLVMHLIELRQRLMWSCGAVLLGTIFCYAFKENLFNFLIHPLVSAANAPSGMIFTAVHELFFTYLRVSFLGGLFIALPMILWQIWLFVAPALYSNEKRIVFPFMFATPFLFYLGGAFMYYFVMPLAMSFFFGFQTEQITALPSVKEYLDFSIKMIFAFGIAFELPVFLLILMRFGVVSLGAVKRFRRYAIVCIFIVATILTPPDPISQILLAIPLILLYELSILLAKFVGVSDEEKSEKGFEGEVE